MPSIKSSMVDAFPTTFRLGYLNIKSPNPKLAVINSIKSLRSVGDSLCKKLALISFASLLFSICVPSSWLTRWK